LLADTVTGSHEFGLVIMRLILMSPTPPTALQLQFTYALGAGSLLMPFGVHAILLAATELSDRCSLLANSATLASRSLSVLATLAGDLSVE